MRVFSGFRLCGLFLFMLLSLSACRTARVPEAPDLPEPPVVAPGAMPTVRVGLLVDTTFVELQSAGGLTLVNPENGRDIAAFAPGERVVIRADEQGLLRYERPGSNAAPTSLALISARPGGDGILTIGGKPYRGSAVVQATRPRRLTAINQVDMETYLLGVVPREIGNVGEELLEAAKAQAVAARTYAVRYLGRRARLGFDVFATVQDQVYGGVEAEHSPVSRAVRETAGEILTYDGDPIEAFYHSTCAGQTAAIEEVWPIEAPRPYLVSVVDLNPETGEAFDKSSNRFTWTERWTLPQLTDILNRTLADSLPSGTTSIGELRDLQVRARTQSGRIRALDIVTGAGTFTVGGDRIRWIFLKPGGGILNSSKFDVRIERDAQGQPVEIVAEGGGWGHGIGMCQVGAMGRARAGQDYRHILQTYYRGAQVTKLY